MTLGEILSNLLTERDLTQKQLADSFNIGASTLSNYIHNTREPDYEILKRFAAYFDVSTDYLLDHRTSRAASHQEDELLRVFRALDKDQQELFLEQGKLLIALSNKKRKSSDLKA
ncbi:MAG: helix-turn-helix domain-containing protein [Oscillospiraceae bacterium]|nr:helix-turn-helix domain-containing protein [Oscillospiraceae bacterium]